MSDSCFFPSQPILASLNAFDSLRKDYHTQRHICYPGVSIILNVNHQKKRESCLIPVFLLPISSRHYPRHLVHSKKTTKPKGIFVIQRSHCQRVQKTWFMPDFCFFPSNKINRLLSAFDWLRNEYYTQRNICYPGVSITFQCVATQNNVIHVWFLFFFLPIPSTHYSTHLIHPKMTTTLREIFVILVYVYHFQFEDTKKTWIMSDSCFFPSYHI